ncbi:hypothetical protein HBA55_32785 [Pseudomaricurvus alkylphenolicus]|uniref:hypothetical protein n=1 Tax=Pseudomaricurvus alkylphenolicus TaxID=1306991 RepID=UPI0014245AB3|nr:hypothetical protein [Pseudomaricurvus alkylphenolicus]NIB44417.1 hypothetical protein [Pseudomaricurvus alkylphenolicus]
MIITIIALLMVALVTYALISQNIERKRQQKIRLLSALKLRAKDFKYMINGFPDDFLPKELNILVHRCLTDVTEQLAKLEPKEKVYIDELALHRQQLENAQRKPANTKRTTLDNPQQVKEVKSLLQGLNTFIAQQQKKGNLSPAQFKQYESQIKHLVIQMSVDAYIVNAKQAQGSDKGRLAIHYYTLAKKLLAKESGETSYIKQIQQLNAVIDKLESELKEQEPEYEIDQRAEAAKQEAEAQWDEFEEQESDDPWKKKKIYD